MKIIKNILQKLILLEKENPYIQAIRSIVGILQYYDHDNKIPVYGFGAKLPPYYDIVSHCFSCNGDFFDPEASGLEEIIKSKIIIFKKFIIIQYYLKILIILNIFFF